MATPCGGVLQRVTCLARRPATPQLDRFTPFEVMREMAPIDSGGCSVRADWLQYGDHALAP